MAWCLPLVVLMVSTAVGDILQVCEEKETTGSYFALYRLDSTSGFPCECVITSRQTLSFVFKRGAGGDPSLKSGNVTLRSINGDKYNEVLLVEREVVNGSHFVLTFPKGLIKGETNIYVLQANKTFTLKCSPKVDGGRNNTNTVTQKNENKDNTKSGVHKQNAL